MSWYNLTIKLFITSMVVFSATVAYGELPKRLKKTLQREMDPIILPGSSLGELEGKNIPNYGLFAVLKGDFVPVPFQIDEKDTEGYYIMPQMEKRSADENPGIFDANDELVFMAIDTGDRANPDIDLPSKALNAMEIKIVDNDDDTHGWLYLIVFSSPPEKSPIDYVTYQPDHLKVTALNYITQFDKARPAAPSLYAFRPNIGGDEKDLIDRVKIRVTIKQLITIMRTEEDIEVLEHGHIDGPVRVVVHQTINTPLFLGISGNKTHHNTFYYYSHIDFPFGFDPPIIPDYFSMSIIDDFIACNGCTLYSDKNTNGHLIDGEKNGIDEKLDKSAWKWWSLSVDQSAFWSTIIYPDDFKARAALFYNEDVHKNDKFENIKGELPGVGALVNEGWKAVKKFPLEFRILHFFTSSYSPGDEKYIVNIHDHPLKTERFQMK